MSQNGNDLLPWQRGPWSALQRARQAGRLPHALLVTGPAGVGKRRLLDLLGRSLLCSEPGGEGMPCGRCRDCLLLAAGTHPDRVLIGPDPEGKSDEIKVDSVRRLTEAEALTAHRGRWKLILIDPAHQMNTSAANSLLKTLEEPTDNTLLLLISEEPWRLPATIRSRCQGLRLPAPPEAEALEWLGPRLTTGDPRTLLHLAHGGPLAALALGDPGRLGERDRLFAGFVDLARGACDPVTEAAAWNRLDVRISLDWLAGWVSDLLRLSTGHPAPRLINADKADGLRGLAAGVPPAQAHRFLGRVLEARATEDTTLNSQMLLESLLTHWAEITRT